MIDIRGFIAIGILGGIFMLFDGIGPGGPGLTISGAILIGASMISIAILHKNNPEQK